MKIWNRHDDVRFVASNWYRRNSSIGGVQTNSGDYTTSTLLLGIPMEQLKFMSFVKLFYISFTNFQIPHCSAAEINQETRYEKDI